MKPIANHSRSKAGFADLYLERYGSGPVEGLPEPDPDLFLIVTIPSYKEPDLGASLRSLLSCEPPGVKWEIIININYPDNAGPEVERISRQSLSDVQELNRHLKRDDVQILCLWNPDMPVRHAGVGLARKLAMDEAVRRFNAIGRPGGVIVAFDADSGCQPSYLKSIAEFYRRNEKVRTANVFFAHPLEGSLEPCIYQSIAQYELYLRYMRLAIQMTGHPHNIHTVGSSFTVRCMTYIRVNGMGRYKAGEDFYFLHKCIQQKNFWEINETEVWPSARESDRVSFGTGASVHRLQEDVTLDVYDLDSFVPLGLFFSNVGHIHELLSDQKTLDEEIERLPDPLADFLREHHGSLKISEMFSDSAGIDTFKAKFFAWFNGFMILQYLNSAHRNYFSKGPVIQQAARLADKLGIETASTPERLLINFRQFEKSKGNRRII